MVQTTNGYKMGDKGGTGCLFWKVMRRRGQGVAANDLFVENMRPNPKTKVLL